jgi:hypothetical protein
VLSAPSSRTLRFQILFWLFYLTSSEACEAGQFFVLPWPNFSPHQGCRSTCFATGSCVERATRHRSAPPVAPVSWPCLPRAHKQLIFFDYSVLGSHSARVTQGCLDSFFPLCLMWCMLLIRFCLAPRIYASSEQSPLSTDFPRCFLLSPTEI